METRAPTTTSDRECVAARLFRITFPLEYESVAATSIQRESFATRVREELLAAGILASDILGSLRVMAGSVVVLVNVRDVPAAVERMRAVVKARLSITVNGALIQSSSVEDGGAPTSAAVAAGAACAAVVFVCLVAAAVIWWRRRYHSPGQAAKSDRSATSFENPMYASDAAADLEDAYEGVT